jgi:sRNA-binding protein
MKPQRLHDMMGQLVERWPQTFFVFERQRRPLKIGIHYDIAAAWPDVSMKALRKALRAYTLNSGYLLASRCGVARIDLHGASCGEVTVTEAQTASARLAAKAQERAQPEAQVVPPPPPPPQPSPPPKRDGLAELREAGRRWREAQARTGSPQL